THRLRATCASVVRQGREQAGLRKPAAPPDVHHARSLGGEAEAHVRTLGFLRRRSFNANVLHHVCFGPIDQAASEGSGSVAEMAASMLDTACGAARLILVKMSAQNRRLLLKNG